MEAVLLLCSIVSTIFTSSLLSLHLALRSLLSLLTRPFSPLPPTTDDALIFYEGEVWHQRRHPVLHSFKYTVRYALVDLDHPPASLSSDLRLHHMSAEQARRFAGTTGPVFLLTIPSSVGYEQNPLSVYYCYDQEGSTECLKICIAEVTNTPWGERVSFLFNPDSDLVAKPLHVSPFMDCESLGYTWKFLLHEDMLGNWSMRANAPGKSLFLTILVHHPMHGNYFTATLNAKRVFSSSLPLSPALFFWSMPQKVAVWIYWQALKLWWKNISFVHHPRYLNQRYREEASMRDEKLQCCQSIQPTKESKKRCFVWRDAQWPWA